MTVGASRTDGNGTSCGSLPFGHWKLVIGHWMQRVHEYGVNHLGQPRPCALPRPPGASPTLPHEPCGPYQSPRCARASACSVRLAPQTCRQCALAGRTLIPTLIPIVSVNVKRRAEGVTEYDRGCFGLPFAAASALGAPPAGWRAQGRYSPGSAPRSHPRPLLAQPPRVRCHPVGSVR